jgi:hypothetical protein
VGLVDRDCADVPAGQLAREIASQQAFRGDVEQAVLAGIEVRLAGRHLGGFQRGIEIGRGHPGGVELVDLVLHQRDQRRDDDGQPVAHQRRKLVAEALAGTGRKDRHGVESGQGGGHDVLLERTEGIVAENLLEQGGETVGGGGRDGFHGEEGSGQGG